jgi:RecB family exonuclease
MEYVSASQIKTFRDCRRKWYYERTDDGPRSVSAAAELGKRLHTVFENALLAGDATLLDAEPQLAELVWIRELCAQGPVTADMVERRLDVDDFAVPLLGYIDLVLEPDDDTLLIVDHKTTSAWRWAQTPETLREDPQAIIYCYAMMRAYPAKTRFQFMHHVVLTKGKPARERLVQVEFTRDEVLAFADVLAEQLAEMRATWDVGLAQAVPGAYNDACYRYGGCPFKSRCFGAEQMSGLSGIFGGTAAAPAPVARIVYRDCLPTGAQPVAWSTFVEPVVREYCEKAGVTSHLLVDYEKGVRQVAETVRAATVAGKLQWPDAGVRVDSADPCARLFCAIAGDDFIVVTPVR